jgi:hypothetical protein
MATGKARKRRDVDRIREVFSGYGEAQEKQLEAATVSPFQSPGSRQLNEVPEWARSEQTTKTAILDVFVYVP